MRTLALLTGRGNNTLKDKNVLDILGHPVLYYPANAASKSNVFDYMFCSSDDEKILNSAKECGFEKIVRPEELAAPTSQHVDCIYHALDFIEKEHGILPDIAVVILANNVTVKSEWIIDCVNMMREDDSCSAVVPVIIDNDHHPLRAKRVDENGNLVSYDIANCNPSSSNRQDLPKNYFLAHNFWVLNVKKLRDREMGDGPWGFMGKTVKPYTIPVSIDIHDNEDLVLAASWVKENYTD